MGAIDSTKISGNFGPKLNGSVPFEVDHFSRSEFWLNGSCPTFNGYEPRIESGAPNVNFRDICSEDDLRSRIFETFVVKFLACLPFLGFSNI